MGPTGYPPLASCFNATQYLPSCPTPPTPPPIPNGTSAPEIKSPNLLPSNRFYDCSPLQNGNCTIGIVQWNPHPYPWSEVCSSYPEPNHEDSIYQPCNYWLEKASHAMYCVGCDSVVFFLQKAICACDDNSDDSNVDALLISILNNILTSNSVCYNRELGQLQLVGLWFAGVAYNNQPCSVSPVVKRAAIFELAECYGIGQYFDNATYYFDSLLATATNPYERSMDSTFAAMMQQFKAVEGENTGPFWTNGGLNKQVGPGHILLRPG